MIKQLRTDPVVIKQLNHHSVVIKPLLTDLVVIKQLITNSVVISYPSRVPGQRSRSTAGVLRMINGPQKGHPERGMSGSPAVDHLVAARLGRSTVPDSNMVSGRCPFSPPMIILRKGCRQS